MFGERLNFEVVLRSYEVEDWQNECIKHLTNGTYVNLNCILIISGNTEDRYSSINNYFVPLLNFTNKVYIERFCKSVKTISTAEEFPGTIKF